ncbi:MAG: amino acid ABC transporter substrate-binding protein, partial [Devosia sp.]|nr:amino acid ABC transporter substrate-binding protein [Devosia sp.]
RAAYADGKCDAYTADRSALAAERAELGNPDEHVILKDVISKEPLGPVVRDSDPQWTALVRWTLFGLIDAEEQGLDAASMAGAGAEAARTMGAPAVKLGLSEDWLVKTVAAVGNYGEIFERNLGEATPMQLGRGVNALWTQGGILYAPPMP